LQTFLCVLYSNSIRKESDTHYDYVQYEYTSLEYRTHVEVAFRNLLFCTIRNNRQGQLEEVSQIEKNEDSVESRD